MMIHESVPKCSPYSHARDVTSYNIWTGEQRSLPNLPQPLANPACTVFNNAITVSGGYIRDGHSIDQVWQLINNKWVQLPKLKKKRYFCFIRIFIARLFMLYVINIFCL